MTLSMATWYGMIKCASALIIRLLVSTPRASRPDELVEQHAGVHHHAVADHVAQAGCEDPGRDEVQGEVLAVGEHHRVAGVVAALVAHHPLDLATEQVGGLALALVAPLGADQHDRRHVKLQSWTRGSAVTAAGRVTDLVGTIDSNVVLLSCSDDGQARRLPGPR